MILVLFDSQGGSTYKNACQIARGIERAKVPALIRAIPNSRGEHYAPAVSAEEASQAQAVALGSPVQYGRLSADMQKWFEQNAAAWLAGRWDGKAACVFTSGSHSHNGFELTLLSLAVPLLHHGMILVSAPYTHPQFAEANGAAPYGAGSVAKASDADNALLQALGMRLAQVSTQLHQPLSQ